MCDEHPPDSGYWLTRVLFCYYMALYARHFLKAVTMFRPGHRTRTLLAALGMTVITILQVVSCNDTGITLRDTPNNIEEPKVVILVIDGARYSETFGDTVHAYIPHIWNDLRPQGTILTRFNNEGFTKTVPGHASILTGTWQHLANNGTERPDKPTIFEYYRQTYLVPDSLVYLISGKTKLNVCSSSTHPSYGQALGARESVGHADDLAVFNQLVAVLQDQKPRLVLAALPDVDRKGHSGVWANYLAAITGADSLAWKTWRYLQNDPYYANQTYLLITNDHGRHDDSHGGFRNHGDGCEGCRHLMFLALGPDIRIDHVSDGYFTQKDVCETVGRIMRFPAGYSEGILLYDIFTPVTTGINPQASLRGY